MTEQSTPPIVSLRDLSKIYYTQDLETHALVDVQLDIASGEFISIAGPSGCGKSTLLAILGLLDTPTTGEYQLRGTDVARLDNRERARIRNREIGFIFQAFNLIPELSVLENVAMPLTFRDDLAEQARHQMARTALDQVEMSHRLNHYPTQLSGGQQQRVAVARALVGQPGLLLADEPTGNLDSRNGEAVMDLLVELHRSGVTVCMVTHDPRFAAYAQRSVHLFDGQIVDEAQHPRLAFSA